MSGGNSAYSPLPQSNSDSDDSSEELQTSQENEVVNRISKTSDLKTETTYNGQKQNINNYKPLGADGDIGVALNNFHSNADEVSILKPNNNSLEMFSLSRKICFWFSLLLCVFTTVAFIWILPCNVGSCLSSSKAKNNYSWEQVLPGLELYGPINVALNTSVKIKNLIFLMRTPPGVLETGNISAANEIISFKGNNGGINWRISLNKQPTDIDCRLIDVNLDGNDDCLVFGHNLLKAFNSLSGIELWDIHDSNKQKQQPHLFDFPLLIPDLDGDKVNDLLTSCSFASGAGKSQLDFSFQNYVIIISGKTGTILNSPLQIKFCSAVHNFIFKNSTTISYTCYNSTEKEFMQTINLINIYNTTSVTNISKEKLNLNKWKALSQHWENANTIYTNGRRLILENQGRCPEDCSVLVDIKDEREGYNNRTIYSYRDRNAYGMAPVIVKYEGVNGFVVKFWKWHSNKEKHNLQSNVDFETQTFESNSTKENFNKKMTKLKYSKGLDNEMLSESEPEFQRFKRTVANQNARKIEENDINFRVISETVVFITFVETKVVVKNIVKDDIIQICKRVRSCIPDVNGQKHSTLITDLNEDGREELISFTSKYVDVENTSKTNNETWQLQSVIRVRSL